MIMMNQFVSTKYPYPPSKLFNMSFNIVSEVFDCLVKVIQEATGVTSNNITETAIFNPEGFGKLF